MTEWSCQAADKTAPIGVFDSGLGGLTVLRELLDLMPQEDYLYLADTANAPYGRNSPAKILRDTLDCVEFLLARGVKLIIIACNTASAVSLELAQKKSSPVPVFGVIEAGIEASLKKVSDPHNKVKIAVIATEATVANGVFARELPLKFSESGFVKPEVVQHSCQQFVQIVEAGLWDSVLADESAEQCLNEIRAKNPDLTLLACTHFPLMSQAIQKALPQTQLVDSSRALAAKVKKTLAAEGLLNTKKTKSALNFYVTAAKTDIKKNIERVLDFEIESVHHEDIKNLQNF